MGDIWDKDFQGRLPIFDSFYWEDTSCYWYGVPLAKIEEYNRQAEEIEWALRRRYPRLRWEVKRIDIRNHNPSPEERDIDQFFIVTETDLLGRTFRTTTTFSRLVHEHDEHGAVMMVLAHKIADTIADALLHPNDYRGWWDEDGN